VFLGPSTKNPSPEKDAPYECGMPPVGDARERQSVKFYLIAMIFLLFDIEVAFLYPWAMAMRDLGWFGLAQIVRLLHDPAGRLHLHLAQGRPRLGTRERSRLQAVRRSRAVGGEEIPVWDSKLTFEIPVLTTNLEKVVQWARARPSGR
jgi:hypothetical protein